MLRFDVFGTRIGVQRSEDGWAVFYLGAEGKHRLADDIRIPPSVGEDAIADYLADLRHEFATATHPEVRRL